MAEAKSQKKIKYALGYSNFTFELWMILHKRDCNGSLTDRRQYLNPINQAFGEKFENLDQYKHEDNPSLSIHEVVKGILTDCKIAEFN